MADITSGCTILPGSANNGIKEITVITAATADTADTVVLTLKDYGIKTFLEARAAVQTTAGSVVVDEAPTTAVSSGVLTVTLGGTLQSDKVRVISIKGKC